MNRKERMKWIGVALLAILAIVVVVTAVIVSRMVRPASDTEAGTEEPEYVFDGRLENVYIKSAGNGKLTVWYRGQKYEPDGKLEQEYSGVADLECSKGEIIRVYSKSQGTKGILESYTDRTIQLGGYKVIARNESMPVYVSRNGEISEKALSDLVVGTSKIELIVAEGYACAVLQYEEDSYETIRVLIKNGSKLTYGNLYIKSDAPYYVDGEEYSKEKIVSAKKLLRECADGDEAKISPTAGCLYLCDKEGNPKGFGYEGDFILRKDESGFILVNEVPIETYLRYVLPSEMPPYFSFEALKAQAVCARTFAFRQMKNSSYARYGANLDDSTSFQVYHGSETYENTDKAVSDTNNLVLTYAGELVDCYYYSTSPGYSENLEVWNTDSPPYLVERNMTREKELDLSKEKNFHRFINSAADSYDVDSPFYRWTATLSSDLGMDEEYGRLVSLAVNGRSASGYIKSLTAKFEGGERTYDREGDIRFAFGRYLKSVSLADGRVLTDFGSIPSACFEVTSQKDGLILLTGGGFGHGIGMSQYGANGMGRDGHTWQEILSYYYRGTELRECY